MTEEQQFDRVAKGAAEAIAWLCSNDGATFARAGRVTCLHRTSALCALILDASGRFDDAHPSWMNRVDDIIAAAGMAGEVTVAETRLDEALRRSPPRSQRGARSFRHRHDEPRRHSHEQRGSGD
jgi:hypothetical protein